MSRRFHSFFKVFSFTFSHHAKTKGYLTATFVTAFFLFLLPLAGMLAVEFFAGDTQAKTSYQTAAKTVYVSDSVYGEFDYSRLNDTSFYIQESSTVNPVYLNFSGIAYQPVASVEEGLEKGKEDPYSLVLSVTKDAQGVHFSILIPESSSLTEEDGDGFSSYLSLAGNAILLQKSGIDTESLGALSDPVSSEILSDEEALLETDPFQGIRDVFGMILPYVILMVLYFLILFYGQSVANSVKKKKSSKLMDTFLISVQPKDMIFGKMCAIALSGILQFLFWGVALTLGFVAGTFAVKGMFPDTDMLLIRFFESFGSLSGLFTLPSIVVTVLMILGGFFLYCALAAVGGAIASKAEDLSATNYLFTMALVISFLFVLFGGGIENIASGSPILDYIPFTAVLVVPSRLLLGEISVLTACISLAIVLLATVLIVLLAGKLYRIMSFYRGKVPSVKQLFGMLKEK